MGGIRRGGAAFVGTSGQLDLYGGVYCLRVEIYVADEHGGDELRDFFRWLTEDEDGPEQARLGTRAGGGPDGAMGLQDVIDLVLTQGTAIANLAMVYANWRDSRGDRPMPGLTFTRASDGLAVTVSGGSEEAVRQVLTVLAQAPPLGLGGPGGSREPRTPGAPGASGNGPGGAGAPDAP